MSAAVSDAARRLVERTCKTQGVPERITDPTTLAQVAALVIAARNGNGAPKGAGTTISQTALLVREDGRGSP